MSPQSITLTSFCHHMAFNRAPVQDMSSSQQTAFYIESLKTVNTCLSRHPDYILSAHAHPCGQPYKIQVNTGPCFHSVCPPPLDEEMPSTQTALHLVKPYSSTT